MAKDAEVPKSTIIKIYATATDEEMGQLVNALQVQPENNRGKSDVF